MAGRAASSTLTRHLKRLLPTHTPRIIFPSTPPLFTFTRYRSNSSRDNSRPYFGSHLLDDVAMRNPRIDFQHWTVDMDEPGHEASDQERLDYYIKTLAKVVGSEEEAKKRIYAVKKSGFCCKIDWDTKHKLEEVPGVWGVAFTGNPDPNWEFKGFPQPEKPIVVSVKVEKTYQRRKDEKN